MIYKCNNCGHKLSEKAYNKKLRKGDIECDECEGQYQAYPDNADYSEIDKLILNEYPLPIALSYKKYLISEDSFAEKMRLLIQVFTNTIKYTAFVIKSDFLMRTDFTSLKAFRMIETLFNPSLGSWYNFIEWMIKYLKDNNHILFMPELDTFYNNVEKNLPDEKKYKYKSMRKNQEGQYVEDVKMLGYIRAFTELRNTDVHRLTRKEEQDKFHEDNLNLLINILAELKFLAEYKLYKYHNDQILNMTGCDIKLVENEKIEKLIKNNSIPDNSIFLLKVPTDEILEIVPFYLSREVLEKDESGEGVLVYDKLKDKSNLLYTFPLGGEVVIEEYMNIWKERLDQKKSIFKLANSDSMSYQELEKRLNNLYNEKIKLIIDEYEYDN
ncbi:MAG: hypothetical protein ACOCUI_01825, partial [bacterium]